MSADPTSKNIVKVSNEKSFNWMMDYQIFGLLE